MTTEMFDTKPIIDHMKVGYREFGYDAISELLDALVSCIITHEVKCDTEFKKALGIGYYK